MKTSLYGCQPPAWRGPRWAWRRVGLFRWGCLLWIFAACTGAGATTEEELRQDYLVKERAWRIVQNDLALMQAVIDGYPVRSNRLAQDRAALAAVREQIASIHRDNLIKTAFLLGQETASAVKNALDVGNAASQGIMALAQELLQSTVKDETRKALGVDTESLTTPRTVRITGLNAIAKAGVPEIESVKKLLASDLHGIRGQEWSDRVADPDYDMTQPGNDPRFWSDRTAILIKLDRVKKGLDEALEALDRFAEELSGVRQDAEIGLDGALAEELQKRDAMVFAEFALSEAINQRLAAERDAAAQAMVEALPVPPTPPSPVIGPKLPDETDEAYLARHRAAVLAEVEAEVAPLMSAIDAQGVSYQALVAQYQVLSDTQPPAALNNPDHIGHLSQYTRSALSLADRDMADYGTAVAASDGHHFMKVMLDGINRFPTALERANELIEEMRDAWQTANALRLDVKSWVQMAAANQVTVSYPGYDAPQLGTAIEALAAAVADLETQVPEAKARGQQRLDELQTRYDLFNNELLAQIAAVGERFIKAEQALAGYVAAAQAADQFLVQSGWNQSYDTRPDDYTGVWGFDFWGSDDWVGRTLFFNNLWMRPVTGEFLQALTQPGTAGLAAYQSVMNQFGSFMNSYSQADDRFHVRYVELRQAMEAVNGTLYTGLPPEVSELNASAGMLGDLSPPTTVSFAGLDIGSQAGAVEIELRFREINSAITAGQHWGPGKPQSLPAITMNSFIGPFETHNPAAVLQDIKRRAYRDIPTWAGKFYTEYKALRDALLTEVNNWHVIFFQAAPFNSQFGIDAAWRTTYMEPAEDQLRADINALLAQFPFRVDPPEVVGMDPDFDLRLIATFPDSQELRVFIKLGPPAFFQWYRCDHDGPFQPIKGATDRSLLVPYADGAVRYYCRVYNSSGSVNSAVRTVTGINKPVLATQPTPAKLSVKTGATVTLSFTMDTRPVAGNSQCQWYKVRLDGDGKPIRVTSPFGDSYYSADALGSNPRISGRLTTTLTLSDFQPEDAGAYVVRVFNDDSSTESNLCWLTHVATDVAPVFSIQPLAQEVAVSANAHFDVFANGSPAPQYQWRRNGLALVDGAAVSGAASTRLSLSNLTASDSGVIDCLVTCGSKQGLSRTARLTVREPVAPRLTRHPRSLAVDPGSAAAFTVAARPGFPASVQFQWQKQAGEEWVDVAGATAAGFGLASVTAFEVGSYRCLAHNGLVGDDRRETVSLSAQLTLHGLPEILTQPEDATVQFGFPLTISAEIGGTPKAKLQWFVVADDGPPVALRRQTRPILSLTLLGEPWASGSSFQVYLQATNRFGSANSRLAEITVEDPFNSPDSVGRYTGLMGPSPTLNEDLGGSVEMVVSRAGGLSGQLKLAGRSHKFRGTSAADGTATVEAARRGLPPLVLRLTFSESGGLSGQVWQKGDRLPQDLIDGEQVPWHAKHQPATAHVGTYTAALLPPEEAVASDPGGSGYFRLVIRPQGTATLTGRMAEGTPFTLGSLVSATGEIPLFRALYRNRGAALGWITHNETELSGDLRWIKQADLTLGGRLYPAGFGPLSLTVDGGLYTAPARGQRVLGLTDLQAANLGLHAAGAGLAEPIHFPFQLSSRNTTTFADGVAARLLIQSSNGTFRGSFPVVTEEERDGVFVPTYRVATFNGVLLPATASAPAAMLGAFTLPGTLPNLRTSQIQSGQLSITVPTEP